MCARRPGAARSVPEPQPPGVPSSCLQAFAAYDVPVSISFGVRFGTLLETLQLFGSSSRVDMEYPGLDCELVIRCGSGGGARGGGGGGAALAGSRASHGLWAVEQSPLRHARRRPAWPCESVTARGDGSAHAAAAVSTGRAAPEPERTDRLYARLSTETAPEHASLEDHWQEAGTHFIAPGEHRRLLLAAREKRQIGVAGGGRSARAWRRSGPRPGFRLQTTPDAPRLIPGRSRSRAPPRGHGGPGMGREERQH